MKIIFTYLKPCVWQYKIAKVLRELGVKTVSISPFPIDPKLADSFDEIITLNLPNLKFFTILKTILNNPLNFFGAIYKTLTIKGDAMIAQGAPHYLTAFFIKLYKRRFLRIYFPYDMNASMYSNLKNHFPLREIWGERYSFKNCDAIIHKNSPEELLALPKDFKVNKKPILLCGCDPYEKWFMDYNPNEKLSKRDGEIHVVHAGTFIDNQVLSMAEDIKTILKQKIHFHIYPLTPLTLEDKYKITENKENLKKYFHEHDFISPEKLSKEISKYDFGMFYFKFTDEVSKKASKYSFGNKRASYFEALLPSVTPRSAETINKDVEKEYLGIVLEDIKDLRKNIKKFNYKKSIKKIKDYRNKETVEKTALRLIKFVKYLKNKDALKHTNAFKSILV
jgi:hypothetical protein